MDKPSVDTKRTVKATVAVHDDWPEYVAPGECSIFIPTDVGCSLMHGCPGCGKFGNITIGFSSKPESPSWLLTAGDKNDPATWTLAPSIFCKGCCGWHGYLTNGVFVSC